MANIVLSAAGSAVGGPIGGAVGGFIGRQIDRSFRPSPSRRLTDLRVQTSHYGEVIPAIYGRMRVAGTVIWASELVPTASVDKSGVRQAYAVSLAVALSCRPIQKVGRIWADGRLIRDVNGTQSVSFEMRLCSGDEDQAADPLISSAESVEGAPAFRGLAYIVLENFDLASFGSRIPMLTFEIDAGDGTVTTAGLAADFLDVLSDGGVPSPAFVGAVATGDDVAEALLPFLQAAGPSFAYGVAEWRVQENAAVHVIHDQFWHADPGAENSSLTLNVEAAEDLPTTVAVRHFDSAREFSAGEQKARTSGAERLLRLDLPAAMEAPTAKALAGICFVERRQRRSTQTLRLPLSFATIQLGDRVRAPGDASQIYVVTQLKLRTGWLELRLETDRAQMVAVSVVGSSSSSSVLLPSPQLKMALIESPGRHPLSQPAVAIVVEGINRAVDVRLIGPGFDRELVAVAAPGQIGLLEDDLRPASDALFDDENVVVAAFDSDPMLTGCTDEALAGGSNLIEVNGEILQFGLVEPLGEARYALRHLLRGRFDTPVVHHRSGALCVLLRAESVIEVELPLDLLGSEIRVEAFAIDGTVASDRLEALQGLAARPWRPAHLRWAFDGGELHLEWIRRCRQGLPWLDFVDAPLGSSRELYALKLTGPSAVLEAHTEQSAHRFSAQALTTLGPLPWELEIRQLGDFVASPALQRQIN